MSSLVATAAIARVRARITRQDALSRFAGEALTRYGLAAQGWRFDFNDRKRALGLCVYGERTIYLSLPLLELFNDADLHDTILHEVAHALTPGDHHGKLWAAACHRVGARPERTKLLSPEGAEIRAATAKYAFYCPSCQLSASYDRLGAKKLTALRQGTRATCATCTRRNGRAAYLTFTEK